MEPEIEYSSDGIGENDSLLSSALREGRSTGSILPSTTNRLPQSSEASPNRTWSAPVNTSMRLQGETGNPSPSNEDSRDPLLNRTKRRTPANSNNSGRLEMPHQGDGSRYSAEPPSRIQTEDVSSAVRNRDTPIATAGDEDVTSDGRRLTSGESAASRRAPPPAMVTEARVHARLVSATDPVANSTAARFRQAVAAAAFPRSWSTAPPSDSAGGGATGVGALSRHIGRRGGQGLAAQRTLLETAARGRRRNQQMWTVDLQGALEDAGRETGGDRPSEGVNEAGEEVSGERNGNSSMNLSGREAESAAVMEQTPPDITRVLAGSHNTIALLLLLLLHYVMVNIVPITGLLSGTILLIHLDQRLRLHADVQVIKSRFILVGVAVTAAFVVGLSAALCNKLWQRSGLIGGLFLEPSKVDGSSISNVIFSIAVVDLWARFLSVIVKALLTLLSVRDPNSGGSSRCAGACLSGRPSSCGGLQRFRRRLGIMRGGRRDHDNDSDVSGGDDGVQHSCGARCLWGAWRRLCGLCGRNEDARRAGAGAGAGNGNEGEGLENDAGRGRGGESSTVLLSRAGRQRRVNAMVEMVFLLYRCVLPVPVWIQFYTRNKRYFVHIYLMLKGMEVSFRADRLARAAFYVRRGDLDRGKLATPEEVAEAGSPDCPICFEEMERPLLLPCQHLFCVECVAEWLDRERNCPLCRAEVPTSNPIPRILRDGRTSVVPQIL